MLTSKANSLSVFFHVMMLVPHGAVLPGVRPVPCGRAERTHVIPQDGAHDLSVSALKSVARVNLQTLSVLLAEAAGVAGVPLVRVRRHAAARGTDALAPGAGFHDASIPPRSITVGFSLEQLR